MLRLALVMIVLISSQCASACAVTESVKPPAHCHEDAKPLCDRGSDQETAAVIDIAPEMIALRLEDAGAAVMAVDRAAAPTVLRPKPPLRI